MLLCAFPSFLFAQPLGQFDGHGDVGKVKLPGSASYNAEEQAYTNDQCALVVAG